MKILITGGAGFIGSHLAERLLREGRQVSILDDLNDFYDPALKCGNLEPILDRGGSFHYADIRSKEAVDRVFDIEAPDAVVHLAARAGVRPSIDAPALYVDTNITGTLNILEAMRKHRTPKLVFASSSSVYGSRSRVPFRESDIVSEPISPYAATKLAGEHLIYTYSQLFGVSAVALRFFTVFGPRQRPDLAINKFLRLLVERKPIPVFGDGSTARDYTYVDDTVAGITAAINLPVRYEVINLGASSPVRLSALITTLEQVTGLAAIIDRRPEQPGDVPLTYADVSKAQHLLSYNPSVSVETGLSKMYDWYRQQGTPGKQKTEAADLLQMLSATRTEYVPLQA
ncbi:MAG TPA: GDP-mannose 4,6-dehydratase [Bryobacteraceae bacterium]|nr:GDP-mannose 4,6-dehydratase [Bryobacteraceae bacterium]